MVPVLVEERPTQVSPQPRDRIDYLDSLRALAAVYVVLTHMASEVWSTQNHHQPAGVFVVVNQLLAYGHFSVSMFIVISGFCLMLPVVRKGGAVAGGFLGFMKRRARRILPPYYLTLAISIALAATLIGSKTLTTWDESIPVTLPGLYSHIVLIQDLAFPALIDYPLWSISVEWRIYFLFPLLVFLWRRTGPLGTTLAVGVFSYAVYIFFKQIGLVPAVGSSAMVPQYIALFTLGMLGATIAFSPELRWRRLCERIPWTVVAAGAFGAFVVVNVLYLFPDDGILDGLLGIGMLGVMVTASRGGRNIVRSTLSWKPLVFIGTMSYSLYLLHAPLLQVLWQYGLRPLHLSDGATFMWLVFAGTPLLIGATYIFHVVAERPFMTAARKRASLAQNVGARLPQAAS